jgi:DNA-binding MarR family transcriptional regulator
MSQAAAKPVLADEKEAPRVLVNPLDHQLGYQLRRASVTMLADLGAVLGDLDLRVTEASILLVIGANPDVTQSDIGRVLAIQRANMVPLTALLTRRKLIRRVSTKGRAQALRLTPSGRAAADECLRRIAAHEAKFLPALPKTERAALVALLRAIW